MFCFSVLDPVTDDEVFNEIKQLNENKSSGYDDISLKEICETFYCETSYTHIQFVFLSGRISDALKIALVTPVYKENDKHTFSNCRPISVLPCFSKILERLMYKKAIRFFNKHHFLSRYQYGFRAGHFTQHVAIELVDKIERNKFTLGIFLDLSKAFDTVNHDILLDKPEYYGFSGMLLEWFRNYLTNGKQIISYRSVKSLSFLLFADDTNLFISDIAVV